MLDVFFMLYTPELVGGFNPSLVKLDHFLNFRDENKTYLKFHHVDNN